MSDFSSVLSRLPDRDLRRRLADFGTWMARHRSTIQAIQWVVVGFYLLLVAVPAFLPLPPRTAHLWNNLTLFAQFVFWGIWWPFVLLSMVLIGRTWCGVFCPEGALTEFASKWSLNRAVPRWITWRGWPFVAFVCTTVYGQMVSVYQYPAPVLVVLGGSTVGAIAVGLVYGRNKRVWCRYLCPVSGVFALLTKLAPVSFQVNRDAWAESQKRRERPRAVDCAPLVPVRTMRGASGCHMCGRCSGVRGAVRLDVRSPNHEVVRVAGEQTNRWETVLILFGLLGVAVGAFHWSASPWMVDAKQAMADWLVNAGIMWPLETSAPWWVLTNYAARNDVLTLLDGFLILAYIGATAVVLGFAHAALLGGSLRLTGRWSWARFHHLAQCLIPIAGCGVFLGLSAITVSQLHGEGAALSFVPAMRAALLAGAVLWTVVLGWRIAGRWATGWRRVMITAGAAASSGLASLAWVLLFWIW